MSPSSAAERKAAERERKRAQGLILKQVWVHPDTWPIIRDLSDQPIEQLTRYTNETYDDGIEVWFPRSMADDLLAELMAAGKFHHGTDQAAKAFAAHVVRWMVKRLHETRPATSEDVKEYERRLGL